MKHAQNLSSFRLESHTEEKNITFLSDGEVYLQPGLLYQRHFNPDQ